MHADRCSMKYQPSFTYQYYHLVCSDLQQDSDHFSPNYEETFDDSFDHLTSRFYTIFSNRMMMTLIGGPQVITTNISFVDLLLLTLNNQLFYNSCSTLSPLAGI